MALTVFVGTTSDIKVRALESIAASLRASTPRLASLEVQFLDAPSGVPSTPHEHETYTGAKNRALYLVENYPNRATLFMGIESGLLERENHTFEECWAVAMTKPGAEYAAYSSGIMLSTTVKHHLHSGHSHIEALDMLSKEKNIPAKDSWGMYTSGALSRELSIQESFRNCLLAAVEEMHATEQ